MRLPLAVLTTLSLGAPAGVAAAPAPHRVIFDTDFVMPPADDGLALILALGSPELEILGVTTVAGNESMEKATADALRLLEIAGRAEIPVYKGANMPLLHEKSEYATKVHGRWWSDDPPSPPPGGLGREAARARGRHGLHRPDGHGQAGGSEHPRHRPLDQHRHGHPPAAGIRREGQADRDHGGRGGRAPGWRGQHHSERRVQLLGRPRGGQ